MNGSSSYYSKMVLKHVRNPKNMGEMKDADGEAMIGNPVCGDIMKIYIKVEKQNTKDYIKDIKFQTLGCGAAVATTSILTTMVKGKTLKAAQKIGKKAIVQALGGLPPVKIHCSILADKVLKKAIEDYYHKKLQKG